MKGLFSVRCRVTGLNVEKLINEARKRGLVLKKARRSCRHGIMGAFKAWPGKWAMKSARRNRWDRSG